MLLKRTKGMLEKLYPDVIPEPVLVLTEEVERVALKVFNEGGLNGKTVALIHVITKDEGEKWLADQERKKKHAEVVEKLDKKDESPKKGGEERTGGTAAPK